MYFGEVVGLLCERRIEWVMNEIELDINILLVIDVIILSEAEAKYNMKYIF